MRSIPALILCTFAVAAVAAERPVEIDPNTRIQGGADVRGSGANAGAGAQTDTRIEADKSGAGASSEVRGEARTDKSDPEKDKPISERKPQDEKAKPRE